MTRVYRILRKPYSKKPFDGEGAYRFGGRWSSAGTRLAYTAEHLSLAMIEYFIHVDADDPPKDLVVVTADVPESVSSISISPKRLPANWRDSLSPPELAGFGDAFVRAGKAAVLIVPSALAPVESNWLINPLHPEFSRIKQNSAIAFEYDHRFFK